MPYTGDLIPNAIFEEIRTVVEGDYFQDRADIYDMVRLPDGEGGQLPATYTKVAENVPHTKRMATGNAEARVGESMSEVVTYHFEFPLSVTWLSGSYTRITPKMRLVTDGETYEVSQQTNPKTYSTLQMVLAVKR